jgi:hypothetical protein
VNSAGFDLVVEIHRQPYNKILEARAQRFPDTIISPAIISENIPGTGLHFNLDVSRIETSRDKATIGGFLEPEPHNRSDIPQGTRNEKKSIEEK